MLIDRYIKQNIPYQYINSFNMDYTDLAKIFDFDHISNTILGLKFSNNAMGLIVNLKHSDNQYGWDIFTDPAKLYTLKALANGNSIDFSKLDLI